ncbi:nuclear transport factor 2 family protein [Planococcus salinarum]|uniref:nuclear transport factor 2 family protein n=1 Tax=Planococcus salinarum TaxID=622695 RepID=UPI000E3C183E|nr:nuclear transport factor 2 family protein [Planococcus salinarum]TAA72051.1 nuclear transport factor 2 family protein [Planococcus salinarum]
MTGTIETAEKWTEKVNAKDVGAVLEISDHNIELLGPLGASEGHETLAEWIRNSDIRLATKSHYAKGDCVICEQEATWEHESGHVTVYTFMEIREGKVHRIGRFDSLDEAFGYCPLSEEDKVD